MIQGWGKKATKRVPKLGKSKEDQMESEKRAEEKEIKKGQKRNKKKTYYFYKKK